MIDEGLTAVLKRRIIASLIDLGIVGGLTALFARSQAESFPIVDRDGQGRAIFAQADSERVAAISREFNRTQEIGDTLFAFKLIDITFILVVGVLLALLAKVLLPANTGWSIGQRLLGLRVIDDGAENPSTSQHLTRTAGAVVDLAPWFIPGLLGWVVARSKPFHRRFGDSFANTAVISTRSEDATGQSPVGPNRKATSPEIDPATATPPPPSAQPSARPSARPSAEAGVAQNAASIPPPGQSAAPAALPATQPDAPTAPAAMPPAAIGSPAERLEQASQSVVDEPTVAADLPSVQVPSADLDESVFDESAFARAKSTSPDRADIDLTAPDLATAEPVASPVMDTEAEQPAADPLPVREPDATLANTPSSRPQPMHRTPAERDELFKTTRPLLDQTPTAEEPTRKLPPPPRHRAVRSDWERPIAETAPVWGPDTAEPASPADDEQAITAALSTPAAEPAAAAETEAVDAEAVETEAKEPQWSDEWDSWLYWDASHASWLRHDTASGRWVPID